MRALSVEQALIIGAGALLLGLVLAEGWFLLQLFQQHGLHRLRLHVEVVCLEPETLARSAGKIQRLIDHRGS